MTFRLAAGDRPRIMGVLNATPDSFSGDGVVGDPIALAERGLAQVRDGADFVDLGGESTRPGAAAVSAAEELQRVLPVLEQLAPQTQVPISIDTSKAEVAERALRTGADVVNDVSGLRDPELPAVAAAHGAWLVLTHNRWAAPAVQDHLGGYYSRSGDDDVFQEVVAGLRRLVEAALRAGVAEDRLIVDPGLGFGKSPVESLELLRRTAELRAHLSPLPLLVGPSRKSFVGRVLNLGIDDRLEGTLACVAIAAFGGAEVIRVHDVRPAARAASMAWAVRQGLNAVLPDGHNHGNADV